MLFCAGDIPVAVVERMCIMEARHEKLALRQRARPVVQSQKCLNSQGYRPPLLLCVLQRAAWGGVVDVGFVTAWCWAWSRVVVALVVVYSSNSRSVYWVRIGRTVGAGCGGGLWGRPWVGGPWGRVAVGAALGQAVGAR